MNELSPNAKDVLEKVLALRKLQRTTGVNSARTQRNLLIGLPDEELAVVARELARDAVAAVLSGQLV